MISIALSFGLAGCTTQTPSVPDEETTTTIPAAPTSSSSSTTRTEAPTKTTVTVGTKPPDYVEPGSELDIPPPGTYMWDEGQIWDAAMFSPVCGYSSDLASEDLLYAINDMEIDRSERTKTNPYYLGTTIFDFIERFNITEEQLEEWQQYNEDHGGERGYSKEEIRALYSGNMALLNEHFRYEKAVYCNGLLYPPRWFADHDVREWKMVGITQEMLDEVVPLWEEHYAKAYLDREGYTKKLEQFREMN